MITLYYKPGCKYCDEAEKFLLDKNIDFEKVDMSIGGNPDIQELKREFKKNGFRTLPVIKGENWILPNWDADVLLELLKEDLKKEDIQMTKEDEERIKERLRVLGYL